MRAAIERRRRRRADLVHDGWLIVISLLALWSILLSQGKADRAEVKAEQAKAAVQRQQEGRANTLNALCPFVNAVATAGKNVISGRLPNGDKQRGVRFSKREQRLRDRLGDLYAAYVVTEVQKRSRLAPTVVTRAGTLNCPALSKVGKATGP